MIGFYSKVFFWVNSPVRFYQKLNLSPRLQKMRFFSRGKVLLPSPKPIQVRSLFQLRIAQPYRAC